MRSVFVSSILIYLCVNTVAIGQNKEKPIVVDPSEPSATLVEANVFGYKQFPQDVFLTQKGEKIGIPVDFFYASAARDPDVIAEIKAKGVPLSEIGVSDLVNIMREVGLERIRTSKTGEEPSFEQVFLADPGPRFGEIDAKFMTELAASELLSGETDVATNYVMAGDTDVVVVNRNAIKTFLSAYNNLEWTQYQQSIEKISLFDEASKGLADWPVLNDAAKIVLTPVSFGEPIVYAADEKELELPRSISNHYDVYWIEFAVTFRNINNVEYEEAIYNVALEQGSIALELIPLNYGIEQNVSQQVKSPAVTVSGGSTSVSVGEFFSQTVAFTTLKPTIVASGLQDSQFSWLLRDEALVPGSKRFVAIVRVPKGTTELLTALSVTTTTAGFLGIQGDVGGTGVIFHKIPLQ